MLISWILFAKHQNENLRAHNANVISIHKERVTSEKEWEIEERGGGGEKERKSNPHVESSKLKSRALTVSNVTNPLIKIS